MLYALDIISQFTAAILGIIAIFLVARKNKWGLVVGLASQPFWFITTIYHQQWPLFILSIVYAGNWIYGIQNWFNTTNKYSK